MKCQSTRRQNLLLRRLPPSAGRLWRLQIDNSVSDEKQCLTIIAIKRGKEFQKARRQHVQGP